MMLIQGKQDGHIVGRAGRTLFAQELKRRRQEAGLSQEKLGEVSGVDRQSVNRAEGEITSPSIDTLYKYAAGLGCRPGDLVPVLTVEGETSK